MNIALIVVIGILILSGFVGLKRGFIKTIFSVFSLLITIILTMIISPYIGRQMQENENVYDYFYEKIDDSIEFGTIEPDDGEEYIRKLELPSFIEEQLIKNNNVEMYNSLNLKTSNAKDYVCAYIAKLIINAVAFIGTFILIFILLNILSRVLDLVSKLPLLNSINKLLGLIAGVLRGYIFICVLSILLTVFSTSEWGQDIFKMIDDSTILTFIYDNNLLMNIIGKVANLFTSA